MTPAGSLYARLSAEAAVRAPLLFHPNTLGTVGTAVAEAATSSRGGLALIRTPGANTSVAVIGDDGDATTVPWSVDAPDEWFVVATGAAWSIVLCARLAEDEHHGMDTLCSTDPRVAALAAELLVTALADAMPEPPTLPPVASPPEGACASLTTILLDRIDDAERRAQFTSSQVIDAVERDRARTARRLHDGPVQEMTAAVLFLEGATHLDTSVDRDLLERGITTLQSAAAACRQLMDRLAPAMIDPGEVRMRVERWLPQVADAAAVDVVVDIPAEMERTQSGLLLDTVRCLDKLIENVVRHAGGRLDAVHVVGRDDAIVVDVRDSGPGGAPASPAPGSSGLGLLTRRVHNRGGTLTVRSTREGTGVTVRLPLPPR